MRDHRGFSLIEVLVVIVIVGVLAALAIAQYASFRARGYDSKVVATVRGIATGEEAFYAQNRAYTGSVDDLRNITVGDVDIAISPGNSGDLKSSFRVLGTHHGTPRSFSWVSDPTPGMPNLVESERSGAASQG